MPQFDPTFFLSQLFWLAICFAVTFIALWRGGIPQIKTIFKERSAKVDGQLKEAEELRAKGRHLVQKSEEKLAKTRQDANDLLQTTLHDINAHAIQQHNEVASALKIKVKKAELEIEEDKQKVYPQVRSIAVDAVISMGAALASLKITSSQAQAVVDDAFAPPSPQKPGGKGKKSSHA